VSTPDDPTDLPAAVTPSTPPRQRVTRPSTAYTTRARIEVERDIDEQTALGEVYMRSLMRAQLKLAALVLGTVAATLGLLPVAFAVFPSLATANVLGVRLPWLLLGFVVYPALVAVAAFYVRNAERNERAFGELVNRR
jgi:hypothetical protein